MTNEMNDLKARLELLTAMLEEAEAHTTADRDATIDILEEEIDHTRQELDELERKAAQDDRSNWSDADWDDHRPFDTMEEYRGER